MSYTLSRRELFKAVAGALVGAALPATAVAEPAPTGCMIEWLRAWKPRLFIMESCGTLDPPAEWGPPNVARIRMRWQYDDKYEGWQERALPISESGEIDLGFGYVITLHNWTD